MYLWNYTKTDDDRFMTPQLLELKTKKLVGKQLRNEKKCG